MNIISLYRGLKVLRNLQIVSHLDHFFICSCYYVTMFKLFIYYWLIIYFMSSTVLTSEKKLSFSKIIFIFNVSQHTNHQAIECRKIVSIRGGFIIFVVFAGSSSKKFTFSKITTLKINRFLIESEDWQKSAKKLTIHKNLVQQIQMILRYYGHNLELKHSNITVGWSRLPILFRGHFFRSRFQIGTAVICNFFFLLGLLTLSESIFYFEKKKMLSVV